eukprot:6093780-Pyramimonas_sp.AAC.1
MRGVILGKEHGRPLNTWKLKEKHSQGVEYNKKLDSDGAVRGHEQIKELYDMLVGKMAVKLTQKDKDAPIFLAMKDSALTAGSHDDDDDLDWVFDDCCLPIAAGKASAAGGGGRRGPGGGAGGRGGPSGGGGDGGGGGGGRGLSSGGAGPTGSLDQKTLKILLAGERALLAAKQELNGYLAVDNEDTTQSSSSSLL